MSAYCNADQMAARFGLQELIDLTNAGESDINATVLDGAIADACSEIDGYLSGRYAVPLNPVPTVLVRTACDLARYYLYNDQLTEAVEKRHKDSISWLKDVSKGIVSLGVSSAGESAVQTDSLAEMTGTKTAWGRNASDDF